MSAAHGESVAQLEPEASKSGGIAATIVLIIVGFIALALVTRLALVPLFAYTVVAVVGLVVVAALASSSQNPKARARRAATDATDDLAEERGEFLHTIAVAKDALAHAELERERAIDARKLDIEQAESKRKRAIADAEAALARWQNPTRGVLVTSMGTLEVYERELVTPDGTVPLSGASAEVDTVKPELVITAPDLKSAIAIEPEQILPAMELAATVARLAAQEAHRTQQQPAMVSQLKSYAAALEADRSEIEAAEARLAETSGDRQFSGPIDKAKAKLEAARKDTRSVDAAVSQLEAAASAGARLQAGSLWTELVEARRLHDRRIAGATAVLESALQTRGLLIEAAKAEIVAAETHRTAAIEAAEAALIRWQQPGPGRLEGQLGSVEVYEREISTVDGTVSLAGVVAEVDTATRQLSVETSAGRTTVDIDSEKILEAFELVATISRLASQEASRLEQLPRMVERLKAHRDDLVKDTSQIDAAKAKLAKTEADAELVAAIDTARSDLKKQKADRKETEAVLVKMDAQTPVRPGKGLVVQFGWATAATVVVLALAVGGITELEMNQSTSSSHTATPTTVVSP